MPEERIARRASRRAGRARGHHALLGAFAVAVVALAALGSCKSTPEPEPAKPPELGARLTQVAFSAANGFVTFAPYSGGIVVKASIANIPGGTSRLAIHENPICTSPNGFSAGPPLLIPGTSKPAMVLVTAGGDDSRRSETVLLPGLTIDAIRGRSVVLHAGPGGSLDAEPDVRNNRIACGVIGAVQSLQL